MPILAYYTTVLGIPDGIVYSGNQIIKCRRNAYENEHLELGKDKNGVEYNLTTVSLFDESCSKEAS